MSSGEHSGSPLPVFPSRAALDTSPPQRGVWHEAVTSATFAALDALEATLPRDGWFLMPERVDAAKAALSSGRGGTCGIIPPRVPITIIRSMCRLRKDAKVALAETEAAGGPRPVVVGMDGPRAVTEGAPRFKDMLEPMGMASFWREPVHQRIHERAVADCVQRRHAIVCASAAWRAEMLRVLSPFRDEQGVRQAWDRLCEADGVHLSLAAAAAIVLSPEGVLRFGPVRLGDKLVSRAMACASAGAPPGGGQGADGLLPRFGRGATVSGAASVASARVPATGPASLGSSDGVGSVRGCDASRGRGGSVGRPRSSLSTAGSGSLSRGVPGSPHMGRGRGLDDATAAPAEPMHVTAAGTVLGPLFDAAAIVQGPPPGRSAASGAAAASASGRASSSGPAPPVPPGAARSFLSAMAGIVRCTPDTDVQAPSDEPTPALRTVGGPVAALAASGQPLRVCSGRLCVGTEAVPRGDHPGSFSGSSDSSPRPFSVASAAASGNSRRGAASGHASGHSGPAEAAAVGPRVTLTQLLRWWLPELQPGCEPPAGAAFPPDADYNDPERGPLLPRVRLLHVFRTPSPPTTEATAAVIAWGRGRVAGVHGFAASPSFDTPEERLAALRRLRAKGDGVVAEHCREALAAARDRRLGRLTASAQAGPSSAGPRSVVPVVSLGLPPDLSRTGSVPVGGDSLDRLASVGGPRSSSGGARPGSPPASPVLGGLRTPPRLSRPEYPVFASLIAGPASPPPASLSGLGIGALPSPTRRARARTTISGVPGFPSDPAAASSAPRSSGSAAAASRRRIPPPSPVSASAVRRGHSGRFQRAASAGIITGLSPPPRAPPAALPGSLGRQRSGPASVAGSRLSSVASVASTMRIPAAPARITGGALPAIASYADSESPSTARSRRGRTYGEGSEGGPSPRSSAATSPFVLPGSPSPRHWINPARSMSVPGLGDAPSASPGGQVSQVHRQVVSMDDMRPLIEAMVDCHESTKHTVARDPRARSQYVTIALVGLTCVLQGHRRCDVLATEVLDSSLAIIFHKCSHRSLDTVSPFQPSNAAAIAEAFEAIAGPERDSFTMTEVRERHLAWLQESALAGEYIHPAPFVVPLEVVERAMRGHARQLASGTSGVMCLEDFAFFEIAQRDGMKSSSVNYWFALLDRDGDEVLCKNDVIDAARSLRRAVQDCGVSTDESEVVEEAEEAGVAVRFSREETLLMHVHCIVSSRYELFGEIPLHSEAVHGRRKTAGDAAEGDATAPPFSSAAAMAADAAVDDCAPWLAPAQAPGAASSAGPGSGATASLGELLRSAPGEPASAGGRARSVSMFDAKTAAGGAGAPRGAKGGGVRPDRATADSAHPPLTATLIRWSDIGPELFALLLCVHSRSPDPKLRKSHWANTCRGSRVGSSDLSRPRKRK